MLDAKTLFNQTNCYINGEKKTGKVLAIAEYADRLRVCFQIEKEPRGQWLAESALFINDSLIKISEDGKQVNLDIPATEQTQDEVKKQVVEVIKETCERNWYDEKERYFQEFISNYLRKLGIDNRMESPVDGGKERADIVADSISTVIEVKRILDKRTLWQAVTQVSAYAAKLEMKYSIVVGLPPQDPEQYELVKKEALRLEKWNLRVIFLEHNSETLGLEEHFQEQPPDSLVTKLLVLVRQIREAIMAYIEALRNTTTELLRGSKHLPMLHSPC